MRHSFQQYHHQRGFAMAAMFIAVALLGGLVISIEGPDHANRADVVDARQAQPVQQLQTSAYDKE